ncbi:TPA: DUF2575 domain-containing protein [Kluyvera intermedia]|uniref:DUF2575 domain-containing protein n=1 Tax=Kluyvera intermedia TaxID=61648 RepID=A0A9P3T786_KLUIN|nr:DUF2575 domain-containing protein [Kluyvera intermedia]HAT2513733.1 DUF2575 domain-containing protein [Kluyvera intermedia]HAT2601839.1 DUF2575 domain-containing protein [Kluyvera intermedia]HAT2609439.1 DUF2575 domain-containing protein [Kluyvera intermedia]HAT2678506.1 DUF2575 domain-containing protein [Kluyvera intermedia]
MYDATLRIDGAGFYQLVVIEYSFSTIKIAFWASFSCAKKAA